MEVNSLTFDINSDNYTLFTNSETIKRYITAGKGVVTLVAPSGKAHSYLFEKPRNENNFPIGMIFVYVLHESRRYYLGKYSNGYFNLTRNSEFDAETEAVKGAMFIAKMAISQYIVTNTEMKLYHTNKCAYCGTTLRSKKAIELGFGRVCYKRYIEKLNRAKYNGNS